MGETKLQAKHVSIRLFLEGIEVPIIAGEFTSAVGQPAVASISIPANDMLHKLKPRTLVHVFFLDPERYNLNVSKTGALYSSQEFGDDSDWANDKANPDNWTLLFAGEVHGYKYVKQHSQRMGVLSCVDFTSYWYQARLYYGSRKLSGKARLKQHIFAGGVMARVGRSKIDSRADLVRVLSTKPSTMPTMTGLLGGCVHLLESITGVYTGGKDNDFRNYRGVSDFLSITEMRLKLTHMIGASPNDDSSYKLTANDNFKAVIKRLTKATRSTSTYGQLFDVLLGQVHHNWSSQLCPAYIPRGAKMIGKKLIPTNLRVPRKMKGFKGELYDEYKYTHDVMVKRDSEVYGRERDVPGTGPLDGNRHGAGMVVTEGKEVPGVDVDGPRSFAISHARRYDPRFASQANINDILKRMTEYEKDNEGKLSRSDIRNLKNLRQAAVHFTTVITSANSILRVTHMIRGHDDQPLVDARVVVRVKRPEGVHGDPGVNPTLVMTYVDDEGVADSALPGYDGHSTKNFTKMASALAKMRKLLKLSYPKFKPISYDLVLTDRLNATLLSPLLWWAPPPRCNVIFPDMYSSLTFSRNFTSEVTRAWITQLKKSGKQNLSVSYFAPDVDNFISGADKKTVAKAALNSSSILFEHEKFGGIVPLFSSVGNLEALNKLVKKTDRAELELAKDGAMGDEFVKALKSSQFLISPTSFKVKHPALARAANYKFFEGRYISRTASMHGPFNPNLVTGCPAVMIDPVFSGISEGHRLLQNPSAELKGRHILGFPTKIKHIIKHNQAVTQVSFAFCREHTEGLEDYHRGNVSKDWYDSGLRKIKSNVLGGKKPILAEVFGWKKKQVRRARNGKAPQYKYVPEIGGRGVSGPSGIHIAEMLYIQAGGKQLVTPAQEQVNLLTSENRPHDKLRGLNNLLLGSDFSEVDKVPSDLFNNPHKVGTDKWAKWNAEKLKASTYKSLARHGSLTMGGPAFTRMTGKNFIVKPKLRPGADTATVGTWDSNTITIRVDKRGREVVRPDFFDVTPTAGPLTAAWDAATEVKYTMSGAEMFVVNAGMFKRKIPEHFSLSGYKYFTGGKDPTISKAALGWVEVNAYRRVRPPSTGKKKFIFEFEQIVRPPWASKIYFNLYIGNEFYKPSVGCGAIVDPEVFMQMGRDNASLLAAAGESKLSGPGSVGFYKGPMSPTDDPALIASRKVLAGLGAKDLITGGAKLSATDLDDIRAGVASAQKAHLLSKPGEVINALETSSDILNTLMTDAEFGELRFVNVELPAPDGDERKIMMPAYYLGGHSIRESVEVLATGYVLAKQSGDHGFINGYTARKFATMTEMFGRGSNWETFNSEQRKQGKIVRGEGTDDAKRLIAGMKFVKFLPEYEGAQWLSSDLNPEDASQYALASQHRSENLFGEDKSRWNMDGFHSSAFGAMGPLEGLKGLDTLIDYGASSPGGRYKASTSSKIKFDPEKLPEDHLKKLSENLDPRHERYQAVLDYLSQCGLTKKDSTEGGA